MHIILWHRLHAFSRYETNWYSILPLDTCKFSFPTKHTYTWYTKSNTWYSSYKKVIWRAKNQVKELSVWRGSGSWGLKFTHHHSHQCVAHQWRHSAQFAALRSLQELPGFLIHHLKSSTDHKANSMFQNDTLPPVGIHILLIINIDFLLQEDTIWPSTNVNSYCSILFNSRLNLP